MVLLQMAQIWEVRTNLILDKNQRSRPNANSKRSSSTTTSETPRFELKMHSSSPSWVQTDFSFGKSDGGVKIGSSVITCSTASKSGSASNKKVNIN